jgi:5'-3' exonuclease
LPEPETGQRHFGGNPPDSPILPPDPLSTCGLAPPIDRLYVDMNGIVHGCSHNNSTTPESMTQDEIFQNIAYYLDRIVSDIAKPTQLVYLSVDGVAPRAKLNQQRSRRCRSGNEGEIEETIYEAHLHQKQDESLQEVEPGRFTGKFESHNLTDTATTEDKFHHNAITPGTQFFQECTAFLQDYIEKKVSTDWNHLEVIFSGPSVPGEGEHKIMDFIRREKKRQDYNPNLRHCIMGQDGDWIMLGLATHEPNLVLLREQVVFDADRRNLVERGGIDSYIHNPNFEWLHMGILRDYLACEFETSNVVPSSPYDLESTLDDFVFLTFFVGNDFLPHMPVLDIADEAFDLLLYTYRKQRKSWRGKKHPYLTHAGEIVCGCRLEAFLSHLGWYEFPYYENKKREMSQVNASIRKMDTKAGREPSVPEDHVLEYQEQSCQI